MMATKQFSLGAFLKTLSEDDTKLVFQKVTQNLEMEAINKATFEAYVSFESKQPIGRSCKVQPQMILFNTLGPVIAINHHV